MSAITRREEDTVSNHLGAIIGIFPLSAMGYELMSRFMCGSSRYYCFDHLHYRSGGQEEESAKVSNRNGESVIQRIHVRSPRVFNGGLIIQVWTVSLD